VFSQKEDAFMGKSHTYDKYVTIIKYILM